TVSKARARRVQRLKTENDSGGGAGSGGLAPPVGKGKPSPGTTDRSEQRGQATDPPTLVSVALSIWPHSGQPKRIMTNSSHPWKDRRSTGSRWGRMDVIAFIL